MSQYDEPLNELSEMGELIDLTSIRFTLPDPDWNHDDASLQIVKCLASEDNCIVLEIGPITSVSTVGVNASQVILDDLLLC